MKSSYTPIQKAPQPRRQSTKLRIMNISMKTKVLIMIKFGASDVKCVESRAKKLRNVYTIENM